MARNRRHLSEVDEAVDAIDRLAGKPRGFSRRQFEETQPLPKKLGAARLTINRTPEQDILRLGERVVARGDAGLLAEAAEALREHLGDAIKDGDSVRCEMYAIALASIHYMLDHQEPRS